MAFGQPVFTTPHVLAEVFRFRGTSSLRRESEKLRAICLELLASGRIAEVPCPAVELERDAKFRDLTCRLGLTDPGLVFVASNKTATLLTGDKPLFQTYSASARPEIRLLDDYLRG